MGTIFDNFDGTVDLSVFSKNNPDPKTSLRRHYLSLVGLLQYVDIMNGDAEGSLPTGWNENTIAGMLNHCIGDLDTRMVAISPSPVPVTKNYFYVENIGEETNIFGIGIELWQAEPVQFTFEISEDGNTWEEYTISSDSDTPFMREFTEKLYVRAKTNTYYVEDEEEESGYGIKMTCMNPFNVGGNTMSLLYGSGFTGKETVFPQDSTYTFSWLFSGLSTLVSAKDLILPATTLTEGCYSYMFSDCTSLEEAPQLPATTLTEGCYSHMFSDCTSLEEAPQLPATTLTESCYSYMFSDCTSLESVIVHVTGEWDTVNTENWLSDVAQSGTIYNLGGATGIPENDSSGCPVGWTMETGPEPEPPHPETLDWFYVEDISGTENVLTITANNYTSESLNLSYSYDKISWTSINIDASHNIGEINFLAPNTKIYLRAKSQHWGGDRGRDPYWASIDCEGEYSVGGNIMSLLFGVNFSDKTILASSNEYAFSDIFNGSEALISAKNLILPAATLSNSCYKCMFNGCISLTSAPELPATELAGHCYRGMFAGCTSLNKIITYANDISATSCLSNWLNNVAPSGTFYNLGTASYPAGPDGIPSGWEVSSNLPQE